MQLGSDEACNSLGGEEDVLTGLLGDSFQGIGKRLCRQHKVCRLRQRGTHRQNENTRNTKKMRTDLLYIGHPASPERRHLLTLTFL